MSRTGRIQPMDFGRAAPQARDQSSASGTDRSPRRIATVDPVVRTAAIAAAAAHLVYGGFDVVLAAAAFALTWRLGVAALED
jgi:hypothetical protein